MKLKPITFLIAFIFPRYVKPVVFAGDQVRMVNGPGKPISEVFLVMVVQPPLIYLRSVSRPGLQQVFVYGLNDIVRLINKGEMEVLHAEK